MSKPNYSMIIIAVALAVMFSVAKCNSSILVRQARFAPEDPLTCSDESPRRGRPILSGATVSGTCLGITNTTTTDSTGRFNLIINLPTPTRVRTLENNCDFVITLPANCTIPGVTILVNDDEPEFRSVDNTVVGGSAFFEIEEFERP